MAVYNPSPVRSATGTPPASASLGSELVTNGTFATNLSGWTATNWTWSAGTALHTVGNTSPLSQSITVVSGTTYLVQFTVSGAMNGTTQLSLNSQRITSYLDIEIDQAGTYYASWTSNATGAVTFAITPTTTFDSAFDNISIKAVSTTAGAVYTYYDATGAELATIRGAASLNNFGVGIGSLELNVSGYDNYTLTKNGLSKNITGFECVSLGSGALANNGVGFAVTAVGFGACYSNRSGYSIAALGHNVLRSNTYGAYLVAIGDSALYSNVGGFSCIGIGLNALYRNVSGNYSIAIGSNCLGESLLGENLGIGIDCLPVLTTGKYNGGICQYALFKLIDGNDNCAFGIQSMYDALHSNGCSAYGSQSLNANLGDYHTAIGRLANGYHTTGDYDTVLGYQAGVTETLANRNITGSQNTWLGANAGPGSTAQLVNSIGVGYQSHPTASNQAVFGNSSVTSTILYGVVDIIGTLRILESGSSPNKYTKFQGGDQSADITYTLPTAVAAGNGYALTSTTGGVLSWAAAVTSSSGVYTPTLSNVANLSASTAYECQYMQVGNTVTVSGKVDVDPTLAATTTQLNISLPIASSFGAAEDCAGTGVSPAIVGQCMAILGESSTDGAQMIWKSGDVTNQATYFTFTYQVI